MSAVHQLVLHPAISASLKVGSTTVGRDKVYRSIQYASRFLAWYCLRKGYTTETVARLSALKSTLGLSRKLMRIGKPLEHAQAAVRALDVQDSFLKFTAVGRQLGYASYLFYDMLNWAHSTKVRPLTPASAKSIGDKAAKCWLIGILFSILSSSYKLVDLSKREKITRRTVGSEKEVERKASLRSIVVQQQAVKYQLVQDLLDILLPSGTLGYHHLDDGVLGIVGTISSLMGLRTQVQKVLGGASAK